MLCVNDLLADTLSYRETTTHLHLSFRRRRLVVARKLVPLGLDALLSPLAGGLGLGALGVHLLLDLLLALLLGLGLVDLQIS